MESTEETKSDLGQLYMENSPLHLQPNKENGEVLLRTGSKTTHEITNLDDALEASGSCGIFQITRHMMIFFMVLPFAAQNLLMVFGGNEPMWRCVSNSTRCTLAGDIGKDSLHFQDRCHLPRAEWIFTKDKKWSIVTEYDLVCDKEFLAHVAGSAYFIGAIPGAIVFGWAADRFGRKASMIPSMFGAFVSSIAAGIVDGVSIFIVLRFICGFCLSGFCTSLVVISCEIVGPRFRPLSGLLLWNYFAVGLMLLGLKAYLLQSWRQLELVTTLPYIFIFLFFWFMPESMRWLWVTGKREKSEKIFQQIAKQNNRPPLSLSGIKFSDDKLKEARVSFFYIFRSRTLVYQTAVQGYAWFVQGVFYYAFFLISDNLSGDLFRDFLLTSLMEIPANFLSIFCSKRYGRKKTFMVSAFISFAISTVIAILTIKDNDVVKYIRLLLGLIGKLFITNGVNALYVWSSEIYPTVLRSQAMGFFMALRPLGGAAAPWLTSWILGYHVSLPFALLAVLMGIEILLCLSLPETKDKPMNDEFDVEWSSRENTIVGKTDEKKNTLLLQKESVL